MAINPSDDANYDPYSLGGLKSIFKDAFNTAIKSTRRMLSLGEEAEDVGRNTMVALEEQKEQIGNIEQQMDSITADMDTTEMYLTQLEKGCGIDSSVYQNECKSKENSGADEKVNSDKTKSSGGFLSK
ncbi:synaptosomal-associated protein 25-like [Centruroides vittatus]|uniref:synaptosomal-associated protein 25-like n=1 Tax=Centruroides vittatus TaxID=120091 RepID=UPI00350F675E